MKELAILHRLYRLPRKPAWLIGFQHWSLALVSVNLRQNNQIGTTKSHSIVQNTGGSDERFNLTYTSV